MPLTCIFALYVARSRETGTKAAGKREDEIGGRSDNKTRRETSDERRKETYKAEATMLLAKQKKQETKAATKTKANAKWGKN